MNKILCLVSDEMADFEVTLTLQILKNKGDRNIVTVGQALAPVVGQTGFTFVPDLTLKQALELPEVEALIIPGGPIRPEWQEPTGLIQKMHAGEKLLAAICFGPQYLGPAGILDHHRFTTSCSEDKIRSLGVPDPYPRYNYVEERVVCDGNVITAKGSAFVDFAFAVAQYLDIYLGRDEEKKRYYNEIMDR
jgi:putative intracellular protease/amidase